MLRVAVTARLESTISLLLGQGRGWGLLDQFLVIALDGAISFTQVADVAITIGEDLDLDVATALDKPLHEDSAVAEEGPSLSRRLIIAALDLVEISNDPHATATSAALRLDQHR